MSLHDFIQAMPKVELHVHLEGAVRPATLLKLAQRHNISLPADTVEGIQQWYTFTDFPHFIQVYIKISECIRTPEDIELIAREFLIGQAEQNIRYTEVTYTPYTHFVQKGLPFAEQLDALNRARAWAESELGVSMGIITDISRHVPPEQGVITAEWAISAMNNGVIALGLGGPEVGHPPEKHAPAFELAKQASLTSIPHAGETVGPESIWGALNTLNAVRIGHGVRCIEDPALVEELRVRQIPLEVSPTSNICLKVFPSYEAHPFKRLMDAGVYVTLNSDDPPMFNTTLTNEYHIVSRVFGLGAPDLAGLSLAALRASLLSEERKAQLESQFQSDFARLNAGAL